MRFLTRLDDRRVDLRLSDGARVATRVAVETEHPDERWGITLDFDEGDRLVGVEIADAARRLPSSVLAAHDRPVFERATDERPNYLLLTALRPGDVEETLSFATDATEPAWGVNLDFNRDGKLVGIELL